MWLEATENYLLLNTPKPFNRDTYGLLTLVPAAVAGLYRERSPRSAQLNSVATPLLIMTQRPLGTIFSDKTSRIDWLFCSATLARMVCALKNQKKQRLAWTNAIHSLLHVRDRLHTHHQP